MKKFTGLVRFYRVKSLFNGTASESVNSIFSNNLEYLAFSPELIYTAKDRFGVTAELLLLLREGICWPGLLISVGVFLKLKG